MDPRNQQNQKPQTAVAAPPATSSPALRRYEVTAWHLSIPGFQQPAARGSIVELSESDAEKVADSVRPASPDATLTSLGLRSAAPRSMAERISQLVGGNVPPAILS